MPTKFPRTVLAIAFLLAGPALARIGPTARESLRRTVAVSVVTQQGRAVGGLTAKCFSARFRHRRVKIVSAAFDPGPHRVLLLLDTSGSMYFSRQAELRLVKYLLAWIAPQDPIAFATFGPKIRDRVPFSLDRTQANAQLQKLMALPERTRCGPKPPKGSDYWGTTAIWRSLDEALGMLGTPRPGDAICLLTDGHDNGQHEHSGDARRRCVDAGVRVFSFCLPRSHHPITVCTNAKARRVNGLRRNALSGRRRTYYVRQRRFRATASGPPLLKKLSARTGGEFSQLSTADVRTLGSQWATMHPKSATNAFAHEFAPLALVAREINAVYRLEIELPKQVNKPRGWSLKIIHPKNGKHDHSLRLIYPDRFFPAPSADTAPAQ